MLLKAHGGCSPAIHPTVRAAETAVVVGDVTLAAQVNLWYGAVLRGDMAPISVGENTNVQENVVLHCDRGLPCRVGRDVTLGHNAVIHSAQVGDGCLVGMGAVLLSGCSIGAGSIVGGGALVPGKLQAPPGSLILGNPARVVRSLSPEESARLLDNVKAYLSYAQQGLPLWDPEEKSTSGV